MSVDAEWAHAFEATNLSIGDWVVVRSKTAGIVLGRIQGAAGNCLALSDVTHLRRWEGLGDCAGSVYDLVESEQSLVETSATIPAKIIREEGLGVIPITEDQLRKILG